jgi:1,4-dihydroxy-2-naphthoyl-CoA hydrolase
MTKFSYQRSIKFADTDAAGVVYFSNVLSICHEAYEEYLSRNLKLDLSKFFQDKSTAIPIIHAQIDFLQPLFCGDQILILVSPQLVNDKVFEMSYEIYKDSITVANALTRHICINPQTRKTQSLPHSFKNNLNHLT